MGPRSDMPGDALRITVKGLNWRTIAITAMLLAGGSGSIAAMRFASVEYVDQSMESSKKTEDARHQQIDIQFADQQQTLNGVANDVITIKQAQTNQIARQEARRVTQDIKSRPTREGTYDRIYLKNVRRMKNGGEPCSTVQCRD